MTSPLTQPVNPLGIALIVAVILVVGIVLVIPPTQFHALWHAVAVVCGTGGVMLAMAALLYLYVPSFFSHIDQSAAIAFVPLGLALSLAYIARRTRKKVAGPRPRDKFLV